MLTLVTYDVVENKPRTRLHKMLKELGLNTQKSVFECDIDAATLRRVEAGALDLLDPEADSLRIYRLCRRCARKVQVQGQGIVLLPRAFEVL